MRKFKGTAGLVGALFSIGLVGVGSARAAGGTSSSTAVVTVPVAGPEVESTGVASDGSLLIAFGSSASPSGPAYVAEISPDGTLNQGFGTGGVATLGISSQLPLLVDGQGRIWVLGPTPNTCPTTGACQSLAMERLLPTGQPDPSFGSVGVAQISSVASPEVPPKAWTLDGQGGVYVGLTWVASVSPAESFQGFVTHVLADGTVDPGFGPPASSTSPAGVPTHASRVEHGIDGVALLSGGTDLAVVGNQTPGDNTFGGGGHERMTVLGPSGQVLQGPSLLSPDPGQGASVVSSDGPYNPQDEVLVAGQFGMDAYGPSGRYNPGFPSTCPGSLFPSPTGSVFLGNGELATLALLSPGPTKVLLVSDAFGRPDQRVGPGGEIPLTGQAAAATALAGGSGQVYAVGPATTQPSSGGALAVTSAPLPAAPVQGRTSVSTDGVVVFAADGGVLNPMLPAYHSMFCGAVYNRPLAKPVVGGADNPAQTGYWVVAADGGIFTFGSTTFYGSTGAMRLNRPVVGMAATPDGRGYWLVASDGGIFTFGDATFYGSTGAMRLNRPVVGMAATPDGRGYWLVASDGGVFSFGDARFYGSTGAMRLNKPVVGIAATADGGGYWLAAADGGVFTFGDAPFIFATAGATRTQGVSGAPTVGITRLADGRYALGASDGQICVPISTSFPSPHPFTCAGPGVALAAPAVGISGS